VTATAGVIAPLWASNAAGTTITSVRLAVVDGFDGALAVTPPDDAAFVAAARAGAGFLAARDRAGVDAADLVARIADFAAATGFAAVAALDAGFAAVAALDAGFAALDAGFGFALVDPGVEAVAEPPFADRVDRRRGVPGLEPVDPVDVSSAIRCLLSYPRHCPPARDGAYPDSLLTAR